MRRLPLLAVLFMSVALHAQTLGPVDWIFLVDTSQSMRGIGKGTKDIWIDVQASLNTFLREAGPEDTVTMYGFDRDVREIQAPPDSDLFRAILALKAEGKRTHLGAAIAEGLERAAQLRRDRGDTTRRQVVVLFTDGKEDIRGIESPVRIGANVDRVGGTFVFFVSMGEHEPQLDAFADATKPQTTVLKAPSSAEIRNVAQRIRAKIPPPPQPPAPPPPTPRIVPRATPPPVEKSFPVMTALIALALLALLAFFAIRQQRRQNRLEGELEILRPRAASDAAFIGLPSLQASEIALSAILPVDALAGNDARLFVRRKAGRKKIWIAAQGGSIRINDIETPMSELYDADTIEIGEAKVRFNRVGDERPESDQEGAL